MATIAGGHLGAGVSRRHFLAGASVAAAAAYTLGPNGTAGLDPAGALGDLVDGAKRLLSIGYVEGSAGSTGAEALADGARVVPAGSMRRGDASLRGSAVDVSVHGLTPGRDLARQPSVYVDAAFAGSDGNVSPFYAWALSSSPAAFSLVPERTPRLGFSVTAGGETATGAFTTGRHDGMAPLHEGVYLLGLEPGIWDRVKRLPDLADDAAWAGLVSAVVSVKSRVE